MESIWYKPELANAIIAGDAIFGEIGSIVSDIVTNRIDITIIVENMAAVLTHENTENRLKGMRFYTQLLKQVPSGFLTDLQVHFIAQFYTDRLKDHHSVIPAVLEGYLSIVEMKNYRINNSADFLATLLREVPCQSQLRHDRYNIYMLIRKLLKRDPEFCIKMGPDLVYGMISAMDGERDPRNLLFLFDFLPTFMKTIPIGHLVEEMFDVISCYYPIDFHPSPDDPAPVSRDDLANALCPCLCAIPEFGEQCLVLLIEKLDSSLRLAKMDSLKLLIESCKTFKGDTYVPFLKALWSSISREIKNKTDDEIKMAAHEALSALVAKLATTADTDKSFENFIKGILIANQTAIAEASTVAQFIQATKILLTTANASKNSCVAIAKCMIPAILSYYDFKTSSKLQIACLDFLGDLYNVIKHWEVQELVNVQLQEIPQLCLTAVSNPEKEYQIAGFKTLIRIKDTLKPELVLPFVEVLTHNVQHSQDTEILSVSVETIHAIARKYPELIMSLVVQGKCNLHDFRQDKVMLQKRLHLLTNLASIDEFTRIIIEDILKIITAYDKETNLAIEALNESMSMACFYTSEKVSQIESDHGLIEPVLSWLFKEIPDGNIDTLVHGLTLISNTMSNLSPEKQESILLSHTQSVIEKCCSNVIYFLVLECLYSPLHQNVYTSNFEEVMKLSLKMSLNSENDLVRTKGCILVGHLLNKIEYGLKFEFLYELVKTHMSSCNKDEETLCEKLMQLYACITKALIMRGSDLFKFWLQKIVGLLKSPTYCKYASNAVKVIMTDYPEFLSPKQHCRTSLLFKQRMFVTFSSLVQKLDPLNPVTMEDYLLSWAYVLAKTPKTVLNNEAVKITPIVIDSLGYQNKELLLVSLDILNQLINVQPLVSDSLQTILPRLANLTKYTPSMDVRIKSLECLYNIANTYRTSLLLPYKADILIDLSPALDDKKRLVRNMAVKARTRWFLVGSPGEQKVN